MGLVALSLLKTMQYFFILLLLAPDWPPDTA